MSITAKHLDGMRRLQRYESKSLIKTHYANIHNGAGINSTKTTSISMNMRQGRELFKSAEHTDYTTRPIELYYGTAAYCRAMTLLLDKSSSESSLQQSHGIKLINLPISISNAQDLLTIELEFEKGGFTEWFEKAQDQFPLRVRSSKADWAYSYETDIASKHISLGELLALIPDVAQELELLTNESFPRFSVIDYKDKRISFNGRGVQSQAESCFTNIDTGKVQHINNINWNADFTGLSDFQPQLAQLNEDGFDIGSTVLVRPVSVALSPLAAYFAAMYTLSMLARYRPSIWGQIWNGGSGNEAYPLFNQLMMITHKWAPLMVSENIELSRS
jgi:hypothetical protein